MRRLILASVFSLIASITVALEFYSIEGYVKPERIYAGQLFDICIDVVASQNAVIELSTPSGLPPSITIGKPRPANISSKTLDDGSSVFVHTIAFAARASKAEVCDLGELNIAVRTIQRVNTFFGTSQRTFERRLPILWHPFEILPLPKEGQPEDFTGAVGSFTVKTEVDLNSLSVGDIANVTVSLRGKGSLNGATIAMPKLSEKLFKSYPPEAIAPKSGELARLTANVIPLSTQAVEIASVRFSYFDPALGEYKQSVAPPLALTFREKEASNVPAVRTLDIGASSTSGITTPSETLQLYFAPSEKSLKTYRISTNAMLRVLETTPDGKWKRVLVIDSQKSGWLK